MTSWEPLAVRFLDAWTTQDVDAVLGVYTPDVVYRDPNTRGEIVGADALRRYLTKLFAAWNMTWKLRDVQMRDDGVGAVLWRASFQKQQGGSVVEVDGMDLVVIRDGRVFRNEVQFDRSRLPT